jgi:hypothetical protein
MPRRWLAPLPFIIGLIPLMNVIRSPRFASIHTVDVLRLIGCGMWFGVGLFWLFAGRRASARKQPE